MTDEFTDVEAECRLLGGVFLRGMSPPAGFGLEPADFSDRRHALAFGAMLDLSAAGTAVDPITVEARLARVGHLAEVGGLAYLAELSLRVPDADTMAVLARSFRTLAHMRREFSTEAG